MSNVSLQRWEYRDTQIMATPSPAPVDIPAPAALPPGLTEEQVAARVRHALIEAEQRWSAAAEQHEQKRRQQMEATLEVFAAERAHYFSEVETEVVQLALAIARKILGREATLDPDLLHALVRIALDRMGAGPEVKLRIAPAELARWQQHKIFDGSPYRCELVTDPSLATGDCVVETDLGTANLGFESQFKEIEQGMLDLIKLHPAGRARTPVEAGT